MLKWLALLFMTIDHVGYYFYPVLPPVVYILLRSIGRLAFPIFAYTIVKGFTRTRNPFHYLFRMASWSLIAHFAIAGAAYFAGYQDSLWSLEWTNVLVLFTFAITMLLGYDLAMRSYHDMIVSMTPVSDSPFKLKGSHYDVKVNLGGITMSPKVGVPAGIAMILVSFWAVYVLNADYSFYGLLSVLFIYISYDKEEECISVPILLILRLTLNTGYVLFSIMSHDNVEWALIRCISMFSIFLIAFIAEDKKKPGFIRKYFFYFYYPVHVVLLIFLSRYWDWVRNLFR
jgi:hypothetical protein